MSDYPFADAILDQTDGGLQIIINYYPDAAQCSTNTNKKFKRRDEKTPSTSLKRDKDGVWLVCDWGEWDKPKNAIGVCMLEENLSYGEACSRLAKMFHVQYNEVKFVPKPEISKRDKKQNESPGDYIFDYKEKISEIELAVIGPRVTNQIAERYHLRSVKSYSYVKSNEVIVTSSTDDYPIFVYDFGDWQKIYQPKSADKSYRFRYAGGRPKDHIFGLDDVKRSYQKLVKAYETWANNENEVDSTDPAPPKKLTEIIICSGDRDAINVASFGYHVVWLNSESAKLKGSDFKTLAHYADTIYNLPDIDVTGKREAVKLALSYLDIKTIWLPDYLSKSRDWRGNPRKDFLDYLNLKYQKENEGAFIREFKKLIEMSLPMRFWDYKKDNYQYNNVAAEHFLEHQGFMRMEDPFNPDDFEYVRVDGNTITKTNPNKIENFVNEFLKTRQINIEIRNMVKRTSYLTDKHLSKLPIISVDFTDADADTQYWFFTKNVVEIKASGIKVYRKGILDLKVMEDKVIQHPEHLPENQFIDSFNDPHFKIFKDSHGDDDIEIIKKDNPFFNYLINISRVHWKKDLEESFSPAQSELEKEYFKKHQFDIAAPNLNEDEILEQKQHLINKIFALGYLCHKYKVKSKAWFVFAIDNKISDFGESHGGSGKSLMLDYLEKIMSQFFIPGRSKKAIESDFMFDGVTQFTDYVFIDDMSERFPFNQFFSEITGKMKVNPKNNKSFTIPYENSPKLCGTSNFPPMELDPSATRRILFTVNSDYYHHLNGNEYKQSRKVSDDFGGRDLFHDFTEQEYNDFYVFMAQCVSFYLSCDRKIEPPMDNVSKRNLLSDMGANFKDWADVFFTPDSGNTDVIIKRHAAFENYKTNGGGRKSPQSWLKSVKAYCKYHNYAFNPKELQSSKDGRIITRFGGGDQRTHEGIYIQTTTEINNMVSNEFGHVTAFENKKNDDEDFKKGNPFIN